MTKITEDALAEAAADAAQKIVIQMMAEKGRGAILVGAARIDTALESLLKSVMSPPGSLKDDNLFKPERPLGTFSAKIALAARLSLIEKPVEKAIQAVRKIRNDFAHSFDGICVSDEKYQSWLAEAFADARKNPLWAPIEELLTEAKIEKPLRDYIVLVTVLVAFMDACAHLQAKFSPAIPVRFFKSDGV